MLKNKKMILISIVFIIIVLTIFLLYSSTLKKELKVKQIDSNDLSYVIENISEEDEFEIQTDDVTYSITDVNGKKLSTENKLDNHILTIKPKEKYQGNVIYKLQLKEGDNFVDDNLKNARCVYFSVNNEDMSQDKLNYEISSINLKKEYTLKNKILKLDDIEIKLKIEKLNKEINIKPKDYKLYIDDKEQSKPLKPTKGQHIIKIQFQYDKKDYEYSQQVNIKEVPIAQLAKSLYKKKLGDGVIIVDINKDGIPEAITRSDYYIDGEASGRTIVRVYSIENEKMYKVCSKTIESLQDMKLLKDSQLYLNGHIASDLSTIYILRFQFKSNKLELGNCLEGGRSEDHTLDSDDLNYASYWIGDDGYTKKEFWEKYVSLKDLGL